MYKVYRLGELSAKILSVISNYYLVAMRPGLLLNREYISYQIEKDFINIKKWIVDKKINYALSKLAKQGYIVLNRSDNGEIHITITQRGYDLIKYHKISCGEIKYNKLKDGKIIVMFDVPEKFRTKRNMLRNFLKLYGYKEIQKSIFISEYDNYEDLKWIIKFFELSDCVKIGRYIEYKI